MITGAVRHTASVAVMIHRAMVRRITIGFWRRSRDDVAAREVARGRQLRLRFIALGCRTKGGELSAIGCLLRENGDGTV
jgi:hypothetical protein